MKKQRSKAELLQMIQTHHNLQKDFKREDGEQLSANVAFWRASVQWVYVLWDMQHFNVTQLKNFLKYVVPNYGTITEDRRVQIRTMMAYRGCKWSWRNMATKKKCKSKIEQSWNDLTYYNTEVCVDFSLVAAEYLINKYDISWIQMDALAESVLRYDIYSIAKVYELRESIYKAKGIWIELNKEDTEDFMPGLKKEEATYI